MFYFAALKTTKFNKEMITNLFKKTKKITLFVIAVLFVQCTSKAQDAVDVEIKDATEVSSVKDAIKEANKGKYIYLYLAEDESANFPKEFEKIPKDKILGLTFDNCKYNSFPSYLSECNNLKKLEFVWYLDEKSQPIKEVPAFVYELANLESLTFEGFKFSEMDSDITNLKKLRYLELYSCDLKEFPEDIIELENLEQLNLACNKFTAIPSEITKLTKLRILQFEGGGCGATPLASIPENIGELKKLEYLDLGYTNKPIKKLPKSFYQLVNLKEFACHGCGLEELSEDISNLKNLSNISLTNLEHFNALPQSFFKLPNLQSFSFYATNIKTKDFLLQKEKIDEFGANLVNYEMEVKTEDENLYQYITE